MDLTSITAALSAIKSAADIAELIKKSSSSLEEAEIKLKLAELIGNLADSKMEIANVKISMMEKEDEIRQLKEKNRIEYEIEWCDPYYFIVKENENKEGPYCQRCYDANKQLIRLQSPHKDGFWECKQCEKTYLDKKWVEEDPEVVDAESDYMNRGKGFF